MVRYSGNDDEMLVHLALIITWRSGSEWRQFTCKRATRWCRGFHSRPSLWLTASAKPTAAQQAWWSARMMHAADPDRRKLSKPTVIDLLALNISVWTLRRQTVGDLKVFIHYIRQLTDRYLLAETLVTSAVSHFLPDLNIIRLRLCGNG